MPLQQLTITVEHTGQRIVVRYNPEEITINKDNNFAAQSIPGLGSPIVQFVNGNQRTLEVELFFDSYDTPAFAKEDVRIQTNQVADLMKLDSDLHAPPVLVVGMASLQFRCVLSRVSQRFIMFLPTGVPVRARLTCTFIEYLDAAQEAAAANLQTADFSKVHVVTGTESLSDIAGRLYDDVAQWRPIAIANGIADPRTIQPGDALRIPALPFTDPATGEVLS
jgi:Contractile injection system tube protein/LysM domain